MDESQDQGNPLTRLMEKIMANVSNHRLAGNEVLSYLLEMTFEPHNPEAFNPFRKAPTKARDNTCFTAL